MSADLGDRDGGATEDASGAFDRPRVARARRLGLLALLTLGLVLGLVLAGSDPITVLFFASYAGIGALLAYRRPRNRLAGC